LLNLQLILGIVISCTFPIPKFMPLNNTFGGQSVFSGGLSPQSCAQVKTLSPISGVQIPSPHHLSVFGTEQVHVLMSQTSLMPLQLEASVQAASNSFCSQ